MEYHAPKSTCRLCRSEFARRGMTRHIKACLTRHFRPDPNTKRLDLMHLHVQGAYNPDYFLHLLMNANDPLYHLDAFLRQTWLECCGHLSAFSAGRYGEEIDMQARSGDVFRPGLKITYQYDFGSTTELVVQMVGQHRGVIKDSIQIIARNTPPIIPCDECRAQPAVQICTECQWEDAGWLCADCAQNHACGEDSFLPVVNSPRTGVCGYTGE